MSIYDASIEIECEFIPDLKYPAMSEFTLEKIRQLKVNTCLDEYGYIIKVNNIIKVMSSRFSMYNGLLWLKCLVSATLVKPIRGIQILAVVTGVKSIGVFTTFKGCLKSFVKTKKRYEVGDEIELEIVELRFKNGEYETIGKEVEGTIDGRTIESRTIRY